MLNKNNSWGKRFNKGFMYIKHGNWHALKQEIVHFLAWKGIISGETKPYIASTSQQNVILWSNDNDYFKYNNLNNKELSGFLAFERQIFGDTFPISAYDPYMIRYGEYQFTLEMLSFQPGDRVVDLGCERNIFILYLAHLGVSALGVDLNPQVWESLQNKKDLVERAIGNELDVTFQAQDVTRLGLDSESADKVIAISSIEHMFSNQGHGDQLAVSHIARILKPGGLAVLTLPMSNGAPFHESPKGDERFGSSYRLYTPEALAERILSHPDLEIVRLSYLAHTTPDLRYSHLQFFRFWMDVLSPEEREKWAWANAILSDVFNPIVSQEEGENRLDTVNTALICLRKKG